MRAAAAILLTMPPSSTKNRSHNSRIPALLSVRPRHPPSDPAKSSSPRTRKAGKLFRSAAEKTQLLSGRSNGSGIADAHRTWFDLSNENPEERCGQMILDNDPPFFLRNPSSSSEDHAEEADRTGRRSNSAEFQFPPEYMQQGTNGSSVDDFRSVIDDLTIENKKLKERLRTYESVHSTHLDKDKLFEVKVHGLSHRQKRELEETLRVFASNIAGSDDSTSRIPLKDDKSLHGTLLQRHGHASSLTTSDSRVVDSGYTSISTPLLDSASASSHVVKQKNSISPNAKSQARKALNVLDDVPKGLLPNYATAIPEKQKKKIVVCRLEHLFTGEMGISRSYNSHTLQQKLSNFAPYDDRHIMDNKPPLGVREANILESEMDLDKTAAPKLQFSASCDSSDENENSTSTVKSPTQRPTRPRDLDPDRAQVPSENMEYIRHLGLSAPQLMETDSTDELVDADGWVYLNLLTSMAQLHIINVTPDFVRSAVSELSTKFQLSPDGQKIRWRGGTKGTRFSSESDGESAHGKFFSDSDSLDEGLKKKRKIEFNDRQNQEMVKESQHGLLSSVPVTSHQSGPQITGSRSIFHYKPLFGRRETFDYGELSSDNNTSPASSLGSNAHGSGRKMRSYDVPRRRRDGAMIFYNGAPFCTDLSADRDNISTPLHVTDVDKDGFSNHTHDALGCVRRKSLTSPARTLSSSTVSCRPFKDYPICANLVDGSEESIDEVELTISDLAHGNEIEYSSSLAVNEHEHEISPLDLKACGLGGSRPADHFLIIVATRRTKVKTSTGTLSPTFSAAGQKDRKLHQISKSSSYAFRSSKDGREDKSPAFRAQTLPMSFTKRELPITEEIVSTQVHHLRPSQLPPPIKFYGPSSSSGDSNETTSNSDFDTSCSSNRDGPLQKPYQTLSTYDHEAMDEVEDSSDGRGDEEDASLDDDSSIDMLAQAREFDPKTVALLEQQFDPGLKNLAISCKITSGQKRPFSSVSPPHRAER